MEHFNKITKWLINNSLWLAGLGLFIASSGIDGAYLVKLNEWGKIGGYALNTTSDIVGMLLMYWFGVFRQSANKNKRDMAWGLIVSEIVTVAYSWLFSWRQYRMMIFSVETNPIFPNYGNIEVEALAFMFAGFIPLLLAFVGYAQGLQVSDMQAASDTLSLGDFQPQLDALQNEIALLHNPPADLQWFKSAVSGLNGTLSQYLEMDAIESVKMLCRDNGRLFDSSDRTAINWRKVIDNG